MRGCKELLRRKASYVQCGPQIARTNNNFINELFLAELASSLFDNAVKMLCALAQARALPEQH